jgi:hypothetical protein
VDKLRRLQILKGEKILGKP